MEENGQNIKQNNRPNEYSIIEGNWLINQKKHNNLSAENVVAYLLKNESKFPLKLIDNKNNSSLRIENPAILYKVISDLYANELSNKTDLSKGLNASLIDEKQSHFYRKYEAEANKLGLELNQIVEKGTNNINFQVTASAVAELLKDGKNILVLDATVPNRSSSSTEIDSVETLVKNLKQNFFPEGSNKSISLRLYGDHKTPPIFQTTFSTIKDEFISELNKLQQGKNENVELFGGKIRDLALEASRNPKSLEQYDIQTQNTIKLFLNTNPPVMETKQDFDRVQYLKDQLKYLGFGESENLHKDLLGKLDAPDKEFQLKTTSDKTLPGNKVDFTLNYAKSEKGGVFLNSYDATLVNTKEELNQNFRVSKENTFTAKEAINLLEGRSVKVLFENPKSNVIEPAFVKLALNEPKNQQGNFNYQTFYQNYGVDTKQIVEKSNLVFDKPEYLDSTIKSLEKGNIVKVQIKTEDSVIDAKAVLNPQYKNLSLYDNDMNRLNTNKALQGIDNAEDVKKNNAREHSISRGI